jgi:transcription factor TFIIIB component B''
MREIDWVAVRQRQREEDTRPIQTKQVRDDAEELLNLTQPPTDLGARFTVVDGNIQMIHTSTFVDREADADREIENYEVVEERDLTTRITSRSFLKNNRRFPNDFLLPGQGKKWTVDDTKLFYQGLRNFGTDFQMISHMFPGSSRRSIKLKFTREERENPDIVRECLHGRSEIVSNWDTFMEASQMEETQFVDADEIKRSMDDYEAGMREKIGAATAEALERKRQQREAGLLDEEGEGNEASNKEKGKRKNRGKGKQVTFQEEAGVEIVGNIDDDHTWGQD